MGGFKPERRVVFLLVAGLLAVVAGTLLRNPQMAGRWLGLEPDGLLRGTLTLSGSLLFWMGILLLLGSVAYGVMATYQLGPFAPVETRSARVVEKFCSVEGRAVFDEDPGRESQPYLRVRLSNGRTEEWKCPHGIYRQVEVDQSIVVEVAAGAVRALKHHVEEPETGIMPTE